MSFEVLDPLNTAHREKWLKLWSELIDREVFAHPEYVSLLGEPDSQKLCASWEFDGNVVLFPFVLRPLSNLPWVSTAEYYDIATPYGYGGAFFHGEPSATQFWNCFRQWCLEKHVVSCFARLSLFSEQVLPFDGTVVKQQDNVVCDLRLTPDEMWAKYEAKVRKNVKRAINSGVTVEMDGDGRRLCDFFRVYWTTMQRREAGQFYFFSESFFNALVDRLQGMFCFFHAIFEGEVVSTELVLVSSRRIYSFLGGTLECHYNLRPNDLLKHEIIKWGICHGFSEYVLGGGVTPNDGIFTYKKSFAPSGIRPYTLGKQVYDQAIYNRLVLGRHDWLQQQNLSDQSTQYFPLYRGPYRME